MAVKLTKAKRVELERAYNKALALSRRTPYVMSSRYYAVQEACEEVAKKLDPKLRADFLEWAYQKYRMLSNYSGD